MSISNKFCFHEIKVITFIALFILISSSLIQNSEESILNMLHSGFKITDIIASDGIILKAVYYNPSPLTINKNPAIIFISSWGLNKWEYIIPLNEYAIKGYTVLSYTARGFWKSEGKINLAGSKDMADVTTVIDWIIKNTNTDPKRIGLSGISYGGGISILGSAHDSRVKSVTAMSCWVDLANSFLGNGETIKTEAVTFLQLAVQLFGKPSDDLNKLFDYYFKNENLEFLYNYTYNSSAINFIENINKNKPAIFIANALGDSLFTPNQFYNFFNQLDLQKHIEFAPGDHGGPELLGALGLPNQVWYRAMEWNDYYLLFDKDDKINTMPLIIFNSINGKEIEGYNSWDEVSNSKLLLVLSESESLKQLTKYLRKTEAKLVTIITGKDAGIQGGFAYITETLISFFQYQRKFNIKSIDRTRGAVFISLPLLQRYNIRGKPILKLEFIPEFPNGTLIIYLLDIDQNDIGYLFNYSPITFKNKIPGSIYSIEIELTICSYNISVGHKIGIVIGSKDHLYLDQNPPNIKISLVSGVLEVPINK